jgi:hypothetical protein
LLSGFGSGFSTFAFTMDVLLFVLHPRQRRPVLLKTLEPIRQSDDSCEYLDVEEERPGQSRRLERSGLGIHRLWFRYSPGLNPFF